MICTYKDRVKKYNLFSIIFCHKNGRGDAPAVNRWGWGTAWTGHQSITGSQMCLSYQPNLHPPYRQIDPGSNQWCSYSKDNCKTTFCSVSFSSSWQLHREKLLSPDRSITKTKQLSCLLPQTSTWNADLLPHEGCKWPWCPTGLWFNVPDAPAVSVTTLPLWCVSSAAATTWLTFVFCVPVICGVVSLTGI